MSHRGFRPFGRPDFSVSGLPLLIHTLSLVCLVLPEDRPGGLFVVFEIVMAETQNGSVPFLAWLDRQDRDVQIVVDAALTEILAREGSNVCRTGFGKALGQGLYEFRIRQSVGTLWRKVGKPELASGKDEHLLLRIFFAVEKQGVVVLLGAYDKKANASARFQNQQIRRARKVLAAHKAAKHRY